MVVEVDVVEVDVEITSVKEFTSSGVGVVLTEMGATVLVVGITTLGRPDVAIGAGKQGWQPGGPMGVPVVCVVPVVEVELLLVELVVLVVLVVFVVDVSVVGGPVVSSAIIN